MKAVGRIRIFGRDKQLMILGICQSKVSHMKALYFSKKLISGRIIEFQT